MIIKYLLVLIGFVLITSSNSNAQNLNIGLSTGYDVVNILQKPWDPSATGPPFRHTKSYNLNCFISYKAKGVWEFSLEPGFMQKGAVNGVNNMCSWEFNYLQIPVLADVYILNWFLVSVGPEFSYMLNAKAISVYPGHTQKDDVSSLYNRKFELSAFIGIKFMITNGIGVGFGYNHGLIYITRVPFYGDQSQIIGWGRQYNQYLQLKLSFKIQTLQFSNLD